jgi:hypothetical protein
MRGCDNFQFRRVDKRSKMCEMLIVKHGTCAISITAHNFKNKKLHQPQSIALAGIVRQLQTGLIPHREILHPFSFTIPSRHDPSQHPVVTVLQILGCVPIKLPRHALLDGAPKGFEFRKHRASHQAIFFHNLFGLECGQQVDQQTWCLLASVVVIHCTKTRNDALDTNLIFVLGFSPLVLGGPGGPDRLGGLGGHGSSSRQRGRAYDILLLISLILFGRHPPRLAGPTDISWPLCSIHEE